MIPASTSCAVVSQAGRYIRTLSISGCLTLCAVGCVSAAQEIPSTADTNQGASRTTGVVTIMVVYTDDALQGMVAGLPDDDTTSPRGAYTSDEMEAAIDSYFDVTPKPWTVIGLCLHLNLTRTGLITYENREEFSYTIKRAKDSIANDKWTGLLKGDYNTAGAIFDLKNNHGAEDASKVETIKTVHKVLLPEEDD